MKQFPILCLVMLLGFGSQAQGNRYTEAMTKQLALLDSAKTATDFSTVSNNFERIAKAEKEQWLPAYYAAYATLMQAFRTSEKSEIEPLATKAETMIEMAKTLQPEHSEISTLEAMVMQARLRSNGSLGMTLGPKIAMKLHDALQQSPINNPRAALIMAQNVYYTPAAYGGGKKPALKYLQQAVESFATFLPQTALHPHWGKAFAQSLQKQWTATE